MVVVCAAAVIVNREKVKWQILQKHKLKAQS